MENRIHKIHIKTAEYEFVETDIEGTPEDVAEAYKVLKNTMLGGEGLSVKDFNKALDRYLFDATGDTETYLAMSKWQQDVIQEIKKAFKRINKE